MAKIGLKHLVVKPGTGAGSVVGKMIQADVSIAVSDVKLYADDTIAESDVSYQSGTITLGVDDLTAGMQVTLLGHVKDVLTAEITANIDDESPFVGVGFYGAKVKDGVRAFRALFFPKVKFQEPADSMVTKAETLAFGTDSIVGTVYPDTTGVWKKEQTFTTEAEAVTYLNGKAGII